MSLRGWSGGAGVAGLGGTAPPTRGAQIWAWFDFRGCSLSRHGGGVGAAVAALQGGLGQPRPGPSPAVWLSSVHLFQRREGGEGKRRKKRGRELWEEWERKG